MLEPLEVTPLPGQRLPGEEGGSQDDQGVEVTPPGKETPESPGAGGGGGEMEVEMQPGAEAEEAEVAK